MEVNLYPLYLSLKVAILSTIFVTILGLAISYQFARKNFRGKSLLESMILLPMVLPPTVVGFIILFLFGKNGPIGRLLDAWFQISIVFHWWGAVLTAMIVSIPLMIQSGKAAFQQINQEIEDAARMQGASDWQVFQYITLPLARHGIYVGVVLSFARALGEFGATLMVAGYIPGKTETMPIAIYFAAERGDYQTAGFWVLVISGLSFLFVWGMNRWKRKTEYAD